MTGYGLDIDLPAYTQAEVIGFTKLKPVLLQNWVNRAIVKLTVQNPGRQNRRLYTLRDVFKLLVMARLHGIGLTPNTAAKVANEAADRCIAYDALIQQKNAEREAAGEKPLYGMQFKCWLEERDGAPIVCTFEPQDEKASVRQLMLRSFAEGLSPEPRVKVDIDIDSMLHAARQWALQMAIAEYDEQIEAMEKDNGED